ncbi:TIGR02117 family protein [Exilibacterium tricleocarpae]|uniref:TIGR02117 family protein n=1 Tax=Exilibacterium tricleocarpae TaxID=2591008 RepID=A0A545TQK5_9GAMM|nr:TIGR02117 family protein [Exilibacterium tricleocarpae]TQV79509.1 TIGR02117 family protein [Exilibacterium tricleocarpae]
MRRWHGGATLQFIGFALLLPVLLPLAYVGAAYALMVWPANRDWQPAANAVDAYLASNGVHVDFVFPVRHGDVDWSSVFSFSHFPPLGSDIRYIAIGWGDKGFYLSTPHWRDLKFDTALSALSGGNESLLHVSYLRDMSQVYGHYPLALSEEEYARLVAFVRRKIDLSPAGPKPVVGFRYGANDAFFAANGSYSLWYTCNNWIGEGLRETGIKVSVWTPFEGNVFYARAAR